MGVEGAFQRVESVVIALWTCADVTMCTLLLHAQRAIARALYAGVREQAVAAGCALVGAAAGLAAFSRGEAEWWSREIVPAGNLILGLGVPLILFCLYVIWQKRQRRGTSCGEKPA